VEVSIKQIWALSASGRLREWRKLRHELEESSSNQFITAYNWWTQAPAVRRTFDPWKVTTWPNPWNLLYAEDYCPNSIVLGIYYTLKLAGQDINNISLCIVNDIEQRHNCLAINVDNSTLFLYNKQLDYDSENVEVLKTFSSDELDNLF
jgi:hypothetical protein